MKDYLVKWVRALIIIGIVFVIGVTVKRANDPEYIRYQNERAAQIMKERDAKAARRAAERREARADREKQRAIDRAAQSHRLGVVIVESINSAYVAVGRGDYQAADIAYARALKTLADRIKLTGKVDDMMGRFNKTCKMALERHGYGDERYQRIAQYDASMRAGIIYQMLLQMQTNQRN